MSIKRRIFGRAGASLAAVLMLAPVLAACGGSAAQPTTAPTTAAQPTAMATAMEPTAMATAMEPTAMATAMEPTAMATAMATAMPGETGTPGGTMGKKIKVGLVTDVGKVNDGTFNQFAYDGLKRAGTELGVETNYIETTASADYDKNLEQFASQNYDMIIGVGFLMGDAVRANSEKHTGINYAIVDFAYSPDLPNVRGLVFAEDQAGYMAGVLAASMSKSNTIGVVGGVEGVPAVKKFVLGYQNGAKSVKPDINVKFVYIDSFTDRARGAEAAKDFISQGADVIFGAGGQTGSGAIQAAAEAGVWVIGVDQDEYNTTFQKGAAKGSDKVLSSAMKRVDNAVFSAIKDAQAGTLKGGTQLYDASTQGVGLAPFHDAAGAIPADVQTKLDTTLKGLADGSIKTGVTVP
jgi:basic membrane protein A